MAKGDDWSSSYEEYRFFQSIVVAIICSVALLFDVVMHALRARIFKSDGHGPLPTDISTFFGRLFNRMSSELMVLGFVAFCVWVLNRSGGFDMIVELLRQRAPQCGEPATDEHGSGHDHADPIAIHDAGGHGEHPTDISHPEIQGPVPGNDTSHGGGRHSHRGGGRHHVHRALASALGRRLAGTTDGSACDGSAGIERFNRPPFNYPPDGYALLHVVEDVHMQIFISMLLYFLLAAAYIAYAHVACKRHKEWEREPRTQQRVSHWHRLQLPLADAHEFDTVKWYFVRWVNSLRLWRRPVKDLAPLKCCAAADDDESAHTLASHGGLDDSFAFADFLSLCLATQLHELVDFKSPTWLTVIFVALVEAACLYLGAEDVYVDALFAGATLLALGAMWTVSYSRRREVIRIATDARFHSSADDGRTVEPNHGGIYFVRLLQALKWRNIFWVAVFFLNPQFRKWVEDPAWHFKDQHGGWRVVVVAVTLLTAALLPYVIFNWAFGTNLPPYINKFTGRALEQLSHEHTSRATNSTPLGSPAAAAAHTPDHAPASSAMPSPALAVPPGPTSSATTASGIAMLF